jgi:histone H3/H4
MAFNKSACKRLSIIAGINRESNKIMDIIDEIVNTFIIKTLRCLTNIVLFSGRKTITIRDLQFLPLICPEYSHIACPMNLDKLLKMCKITTDILCGEKGYALFTLKKPFNELIHKILREQSTEEIRIGRNVGLLLQTMTEHHIITIMNRAGSNIAIENRDTLLLRDIENAIR